MGVSSKSRTLLIVDDDERIRRDLYDAFAPHGWQIFQAASGQEAYKVVCSHSIDLVTCDMQMPRGNGMWLLERLLLEKRKPMFFCFYSSLFRAGSPANYVQGADRVFAKYSEFQELCEWVTESLGLLE